MKKYKEIFYLVARVLLGVLFFYSAYAKTLSIEDFELKIIQSDLIGWSYVSLLSFFIITCEFILGLYFISIIIYSRVVQWLAYLFLILFTIYLLIIFKRFGNDINCGCMGNEIPFTPLQAIIKNIIALGLMIYVSKYKNLFVIDKKKKNLIITSFILISFIISMILLPFDFSFSSSFEPDMKEKFEYEIIQTSGKFQKAEFDFNQPKYVAAFLSMTCKHCSIAAHKLSEIHKSNNNIPLVIILNGDSSETIEYLKTHHIAELPYTMLYGNDFIHLAGTKLPSIYLVEDGKIVKRITHREINATRLNNWLR
jgi:hypothetical protein